MTAAAFPEQPIAQQIDDATSVASLRTAALQIEPMVARLQGGGESVEHIARLVTALNRRLFAKLWGVLAPADLVGHSCLLVMGSEGRGEQILKTDQDNALVLRDGFECATLADVAGRFNAALADFGYPPCPGGVMLSSPQWRQPLAGFRESLRQWLYGADPDGPMQLAIFFDAAAVAGDASLLQAARDHLDHILAGQDTYLARFAAAADQFRESGSWWSRLTGHGDDLPLDLKKLGIFPIVHGARALSLQYGVRRQGTAARLEALATQGRIDRGLAQELVQALHALMALRLAHQLRQRAAGTQPGHVVQPSALPLPQRESLRTALVVVKRFRQFLRQHFRLDSL